MAKNTGLGKGLDALFSDKTVIEDIKKSMQEDGFHKEEPLVIAKLPDGTVLGVADGNTRLMIAKKIGMDEIPVVCKRPSVSSAKSYTGRDL